MLASHFVTFKIRDKRSADQISCMGPGDGLKGKEIIQVQIQRRLMAISDEQMTVSTNMEVKK